MSCQSVRECLQEHLEGTRHPLELAGRLPDWAQRHLEGCPGCREASWQLVSLECSLRRLEETPAIPVDLTASVMKALAARPVAAPSRDRRWMQAAAVLLLGLSLYGLTWVPVPTGWELWLTPGWSLPSLEVPGLNETLLSALAAVSLLCATALNWRWGGAH